MKIRILIMAGGTGGHVFPALSVAKACIEEGMEVLWLGTRQGMEAELVPKAGIPIRYITVQGLRRHGLFRKLLAPFQVFRALLQSLKILYEFKPNIVLGMGGYVAGPGGIAAWLLRIPLVIHEQNAISGVTNRILARFAKRVLEGFPESFPKNIPAIWVGNPVRTEIINLPSPDLRLKHLDDDTGQSKELNVNKSQGLKILVLGGSQGALAINQMIPSALLKIPTESRPSVWHQCGKHHFDLTRAAYQSAGLMGPLNLKLEPFIQNMSEAYAWADLVICRAGALTVSELAAAGLGSILIPFPYAVDDHQTYNGRFLERVAAAKLIPQSRLDPTILADIIKGLSKNRKELLNMAVLAKGLAKPKAVLDLISYCQALL